MNYVLWGLLQSWNWLGSRPSRTAWNSLLKWIWFGDLILLIWCCSTLFVEKEAHSDVWTLWVLVSTALDASYTEVISTSEHQLPTQWQSYDQAGSCTNPHPLVTYTEQTQCPFMFRPPFCLSYPPESFFLPLIFWCLYQLFLISTNPNVPA